MEEKLLSAGNLVCAQTITGAVIIGLLSAKGELYTTKGIENYYVISVTDKASIQLRDSEIDNIKKLETQEETYNKKEAYFTGLEEKYSTRFHNLSGELLEDNELLVNAISYRVWDALNDEQKEEFIDQIHLKQHDFLELFDSLQMREIAFQKMCREEEKNNAAKENFLINYEKFKEAYPLIEATYQVFYKYLGLDELVK